MNIVELIAEEQHPSPCHFGNVVDGHACYCHHPSPHAPRKCPIWRSHGTGDLSKWRRDPTWDNGCPYFAPQKKQLVSE